MADYAAGSSRRWDSQTWSLTLGHVFGIRVRIHLLFLVYIVGEILFHLESLDFYLPMVSMLFVIVLLHEFGHCFGCRFMGGQADDILLWPLGGLAYVNPPHRPYEHLITTLAGPAVNVVLLAILIPVLYFQGVLEGSLFNPFVGVYPYAGSAFYTTMAFKLSFWLLLFNLLPFFPMDGGRIVQESLWFKLSHYHATMIATSVGLVGASGMVLLGVYLSGAWSSDYLLLSMVGFFGLYYCLMTRRQMEILGQMPENEFGYDFSQGYTSLERSMARSRRREGSPTLRSRFQAWLERRRKREAARLEAELDRILEKIHNQGIESLTREERRILTQASKNRRARS